MQTLNGKKRRYLRGLAHHLDPVVHLGKDGLGGATMTAVDQALLDHELIKVRVLEHAPLSRAEAAIALSEQLEAELVGELGRVVILYRRRKEGPTIVLPA